MKLRLLVAVSAVIACLSCQKSISENIDEPSSTGLIGTYDFVEMITSHTSVQTDTSSGIISKVTRIDTSKTETTTGTLQITADKFILANINGTGINYYKQVIEEQGQQPVIDEDAEPYGFEDPITSTTNYIKAGQDSISLFFEDGTTSPEIETHHYRFSGDTLILSVKEREISYYNQGSIDNSYSQRMKFKRKK
ncbi:hypothetical protein [Flavihumibacter solisilvae]|uniref:Uncharacterized protein n=1 Tax=Flavihumibacter solisilvae TaxID=1349421 RepID=A0A0C1L4D9_9BACT|nr:hypothetical protein [Flavihumibacter solisilvae]KIC94451.1 hypothetical protein OI18_12685 [Flavihumibacter solisilvae]